MVLLRSVSFSLSDKEEGDAVVFLSYFYLYETRCTGRDDAAVLCCLPATNICDFN